MLNTLYAKCWSLPPILAHLLFCRGLPAGRCPKHPVRLSSSTIVERTLQISPFLCKTNPIFCIFHQKMKIMPKNKPNSKPIKPNFGPISRVAKPNKANFTLDVVSPCFPVGGQTQFYSRMSQSGIQFVKNQNKCFYADKEFTKMVVDSACLIYHPKGCQFSLILWYDKVYYFPVVGKSFYM
jgi:hypothetical protein